MSRYLQVLCAVAALQLNYASDWKIDWSKIRYSECHQVPFSQTYSSSQQCDKGPRGHRLSFGHHQQEPQEIETLSVFPEPDVFYRDYIRKSRPLLVRGGAKDWPAVAMWPNMTYFKEAFGDGWFQIQFKKIYDKFHQFYAPMTMREFVNLLDTKDVYLDATISPKMTKDIIWPKYLHCDTLIKMIKQVAMFMNNGGTSSDIHMDVTETFMAQVRGKRQWIIMSPDSARYLYLDHNAHHRGSSPVNQSDVNLETFPDVSKITVYNVTVDQGDIIYVPEGWFHQVQAYPRGEPNIGIAIFLNFLYCMQRVHMPERYDSDLVYLKGCQAWREMQVKEINCSFPAGHESLEEIVRKHNKLNKRAFEELMPGYKTEPGFPGLTGLPSGHEIPEFGYRIHGTEEEALRKIVSAMKIGYRLFETSVEDPVSSQKAMSKALRIDAPGTPKRQDVFISVPVHPSHLGYNSTRESLELALKTLKTNYVDLAVLLAPSCDTVHFPCTDSDKLKVGSWMDSWQAMQDLHRQKKIKSLGVAHFSLDEIKQLLKSPLRETKLSVVMDEFNPVRQNEALLKFCQENDIVFIGHSILGTQLQKQYQNLTKNPVLRSETTHLLSYRYRACPAAIVTRWAVTKGVVPLFRTSDPWHLLYNWKAHTIDLQNDGATIQKLEILKENPFAGDDVVDPDYVKVVRQHHFQML